MMNQNGLSRSLEEKAVPRVQSSCCTKKEVNVAPSLSRIGSDSSKTPPGIANLDDVLDDLRKLPM